MMLTWIISSSVLLAGFLVLRHILTAAMSVGCNTLFGPLSYSVFSCHSALVKQDFL